MKVVSEGQLAAAGAASSKAVKEAGACGESWKFQVGHDMMIVACDLRPDHNDQTRKNAVRSVHECTLNVGDGTVVFRWPA
jgi:hypothetical protein